MKQFLLILVIALLGSCTTGFEDYPLVQAPTAVISQAEFVTAFSDICLKSPNRLSDFGQAARRLDLAQSQASNRFGNSSYVWEASKERGWSPLVLRVSTGNILYELMSGTGSGLPTRARECSLTAFLAETDTESQQTLKVIAEHEFDEKSNGLDFSAYSEGHEVTADDVRVTLDLPGRLKIVQIPPGAKCEGRQQCSIYRPTKLTLEVVLNRLP